MKRPNPRALAGGAGVSLLGAALTVYAALTRRTLVSGWLLGVIVVLSGLVVAIAAAVVFFYLVDVKHWGPPGDPRE